MSEFATMLKEIDAILLKDRDGLVATNGVQPLTDIRDHDFRRGVIEGLRRAQSFLADRIRYEQGGGDVDSHGELPEMPDVEEPETVN